MINFFKGNNSGQTTISFVFDLPLLAGSGHLIFGSPALRGLDRFQFESRHKLAKRNFPRQPGSEILGDQVHFRYLLHRQPDLDYVTAARRFLHRRPVLVEHLVDNKAMVAGRGQQLH